MIRLLLLFLPLWGSVLSFGVTREDCARSLLPFVGNYARSTGKTEMLFESLWELLHDANPEDAQQVLTIIEGTLILPTIVIDPRADLLVGGGVTTDEKLAKTFTREGKPLGVYYPYWTFRSALHTLSLGHETVHILQSVRGETTGEWSRERVIRLETPAFQKEYKDARRLFSERDLELLRAATPIDTWRELNAELIREGAVYLHPVSGYAHVRHTKWLEMEKNPNFTGTIDRYLRFRAVFRAVEKIELAFAVTETEYVNRSLAPYLVEFEN